MLKKGERVKKLFKYIRKILRYLFWGGLMFSVIFPLIFFFGAKQIGVLEARYDLYRGRYEIHGYGLIWGEPLHAPILNRYGVRYRHVAGCGINDFIIDSVASYNSVMKDAIRKDLEFDVDQLWMSLYGTTVDGYTSETFKHE